MKKNLVKLIIIFTKFVYYKTMNDVCIYYVYIFDNMLTAFLNL